MTVRKPTKAHLVVDKPEVWRLLLERGLDDLAPHALSAGTDGEAWWASLRNEHAIARAGMDFGSVSVADVVRRAVRVAGETDPAAKALSLELAPRQQAELRDKLDSAEAFASTRWAARAALELSLGRAKPAVFSALEALRLTQRDASENWAPRPAELTRWVAPHEVLDLVRDAPFPGWLSVRRLDGAEGAPDAAMVRALMADEGLELGGAGPLPFTGATMYADGALFVVHRPRLAGSAWDPIVQRYIEVRGSDKEGIAWRIGGPSPTDAERLGYNSAVENALTDAIERSDDSMVRRTWRAFVRSWPAGDPAFSVPPSEGGWRRIIPGGEGLARFAERWGAHP